jgi:outer membrane autotransporter protein
MQDNWMFQPSASISYIDDVSKAYIDSLGVSIPSVRSSLGQTKFGPEVSYRHVLNDGTVVEPRMGLQAIWNFSAGSSGTDFGGT